MSATQIELYNEKGQCVYRFMAPLDRETQIALHDPLSVLVIKVQNGWQRGPALPTTEQERLEEWFEWWTHE